jgi:hypothetical protein
MMTQETINFQKLAQWQKSASSNRALVRLLQESAQETLNDKVTPLALAFHQAAVAAAYQHYGFMAFSPESRRMLAIAQSRQSKVSSTSLLEWLDYAAYQQLADFHLLKYVETEPDWLDLSQEFCISVIKRIVVCSKDEWHLSGLEHFPVELLNALAAIVGSQLAQIKERGSEAQICASSALHKAQIDNTNLLELLFPSIELWGRALDFVLCRVAQEPLLILSWRLEVFTTERQLQCDASLAVLTTAPLDAEERSLKIILLILLLSGFNFGTKTPIVPETPLTQSQLIKSIEHFFAMESSSANLVAAILNPRKSKSDLKFTIEKLIELGDQLGVFSKASLSRSQKGVLLTSLAFRITDPYRELIESTFNS